MVYLCRGFFSVSITLEYYEGNSLFASEGQFEAQEIFNCEHLIQLLIERIKVWNL